MDRNADTTDHRGLYGHYTRPVHLLIFTFFALTGCLSTELPVDGWEHSDTGLFDAAISRDGRFALVSSFGDGASYWNLTTNERLYDWRHHATDDIPVAHVAISPDNTHALTTDTTAFVVWNTTTGQSTGYWQVPADITAAALSAGGRHVLIGLKNGTAIHMNMQTRRRLEVTAHQGEWVTNVDISADGQIAVSGGNDGRVVVWDTHSGKERFIADHHARVVYTRFDPSHEKLLSADERGGVQIRDAMTGSTISELKLDPRRNVISAARFSDDGSKVLLGFPGRDVVLWDGTTGKQIQTWRMTSRMNGWVPQGGTIYDVAFVDGTTKIVAESSNGLGQTWTIN